MGTPILKSVATSGIAAYMGIGDTMPAMAAPTIDTREDFLKKAATDVRLQISDMADEMSMPATKKYQSCPSRSTTVTRTRCV